MAIWWLSCQANSEPFWDHSITAILLELAKKLSLDTVELCGDILQPGGILTPLVLFKESLLYLKRENELIKLKPFLPCSIIDHCNIID